MAPPVAVLAWTGLDADDSVGRLLSLVTGLAALTLLLATFVLPSRVRALTAHLGIERLLRHDRAVALGVRSLVLLHVAAVLAPTPSGGHVLDLRTEPPRVRVAATATAGLILIVASAASRRRRGPHYEGWRLAEVVLGSVGVVQPACTRYVVDQVRQEPATAVLHASGHAGVPFAPGQLARLTIGTSPFVFEGHPVTIASATTEPWRRSSRSTRTARTGPSPSTAWTAPAR